MAVVGKLALTLMVIFAISLAQVTAVEDLQDLGEPCSVQSNCNPANCDKPVQSCCVGTSYALTGRGGENPKLTAFMPGRCVCCAMKCVHGFAHALGSTQHTFAHTDAYTQVCSNTH